MGIKIHFISFGLDKNKYCNTEEPETECTNEVSIQLLTAYGNK